MRVLVVNAGSSSLKHALVDSADQAILARGEERWQPDAGTGLHADALRAALADAGGLADAVGHRVVHGGPRFTDPVRIDQEVRAAIAELAPLAPLHTRAALEGIDAAAAALPGVPQVACFDTAFHTTLAPEAATYALPREWTERLQLRRYGFHGLNVSWCHEQAARILGAERSRRLVVCHLGSGCSVTAVLDGRSIDTTMGFTPLDGVPMATRSGSVDPGLLLYLLASGIGHEELADALNHRSGLLGMTGLAGVLEVERAANAGDGRAQLALDVLVRGVSSAVAAMTTSLRGVDAIVFSAGAGERSPLLREAICARLGQLGVALDDDANRQDAERISAAGGRVAVLVVRAGEEIVIARETARLLGAPKRPLATPAVGDADIRIRPIRAGDEAAINRLLVDLDPESRRRRWFTGGVDIVRAVDWAAHPDRSAAVGLLALAGETPVGHAALVPLVDGRGEVAFEVAAPWRHHGIAGALLERLIEAAAARGLREVYAEVLPENADMLAVLREHGEHAERRDGGVVTVTVPVA